MTRCGRCAASRCTCPTTSRRSTGTDGTPPCTWPRTGERQEHLEELVAAGADGPGIVAACLRPPLYATRFGAGFGTLYTAEYRPAEGTASYHWPESVWTHSLDDLRPGTIQVRLGGR